MKNIRTKLAAIIMTGFLMAGTTFAGDGILMSDSRAERQPTCIQTNGGILMSDFTGIIISGFTGIIISGVIDTKCSE